LVQASSKAVDKGQRHLVTKHFNKKSISRQVRTLSPVHCKQKLTCELMHHQSKIAAVSNTR